MSEYELNTKVRALIDQGVTITNPFTVEIGGEVMLERIARQGVCLHSGTRIFGERTLICPGAKIGCEGPVTLENCTVGPQVELNGGFFKSSAFLSRVKIAAGAYVREGCLLEEGARGGHTVGLKQTILFPFVTLGSLINFCDCFMAGGSSEKNHSEVGSSYVHFNYTPNQDKATPSLLGDVPRGVMLREEVIFLGGQGGLVGPARVDYGAVIPAGRVVRRNNPEADGTVKKTYQRGSQRRFVTVAYNNIRYLANLLALREWYLHVRRPFFQVEPWGVELHAGALAVINANIEERLKRFYDLALRPGPLESEKGTKPTEEDGLASRQREELLKNWPQLSRILSVVSVGKENIKERTAFLAAITAQLDGGRTDYLEAIRTIDQDDCRRGTGWLAGIVEETVNEAWRLLPSCPRDFDSGYNG
ncbi:MAG: UDP-N-acetylglucosamine pyrophosphorylase [Smithellaceae bacterium]|nr:UDP-N-acetylglucosamine pyrophosphorylase [Smithellaceae bacterium]